MEKTVTTGGESFTVRRRTNLSEMIRNGLISQFATLFEQLAGEIGHDTNAVDGALTRYAQISAQTQAHPLLAASTDGKDELYAKCKAWLLDVNPAICDVLWHTVIGLNRTWGSEDTAPAPLAKDADPKA
jgi:hypothetical protein